MLVMAYLRWFAHRSPLRDRPTRQASPTIFTVIFEVEARTAFRSLLPALCLKPVFFRMAIYSAAHLIQIVSASAPALLGFVRLICVTKRRELQMGCLSSGDLKEEKT